jgi:glycosyltransferase involved in cell wall biosynthesis
MSALRVHYSAFDVVPSPKGASTHITWFVRGLVTAGASVDLVTVGDGQLPALGAHAGASVHRIGRAAADTFLGRALEFGDTVVQRLERAGPGAYEVCHFRNAWCGLPIVEAAQRLGYRTVFEVNGLPSVELKYHYPALRGSASLERIRQREILTLLQADAVVCPSRVTASFLESLGVEPERLTVIPNGMEPSLFRATSLPLARSPARLLYVGTLAEWQGLSVLLKALAVVRREVPAELYILGSGRERQRRRLLRAAERLALAGAVFLEAPVVHEQVAEWIAAADVCVAPLGYNERNVTQGCCPLKVIEYMACARPVVAANLPVVRELLRDGIEGLLFEPDNSDDLGHKLLSVLRERELAGRLALAGARRAHADFSWRTAQLRLLTLYEGLLGRSLSALADQTLQQREIGGALALHAEGAQHPLASPLPQLGRELGSGEHT